ncbi:MAG TPA: two-component system sensor histidine kinase DcuS [Clostridia bacterium]|nr:two-component system sensor histidine kinase DcuS [Clostridia bacterium]
MLLKPLGLQAKITWLAFSVVLISLVLGAVVLVGHYARSLEQEIGYRALAIARALSQMEEIQQNVGKPGGSEVIQPIAERTRLATNVEYIVVLDMNKIRYSHPLESYIGTTFGGGDEGPAFANHEYLSRAEGVLGPSIRAFVPVKTDEGLTQVGVVVVGVLTPTLRQILFDIRWEIGVSLLVGILAGFIGSVYLAKDIKKTLFNLEPWEIAQLLEERIAIFQALEDGIVAIDREHKITVFNEAARRLTGVSGDVIGKPILEVIPDSRLPKTAVTGEAVFNQERPIGKSVILTSRFPIKVKGEIVGAVSLFRDKTEVRRLAEELTGVKQFIEALRVQSHEYMNKLHTIAGLLQLKRYEEAMEYIFAVSEEQQELTTFLGRNIKDYSVAGLLLGKYSRAKELQIELVIDRRSRMSSWPEQGESAPLVIILGNLLENAMEAVADMPAERRKVYCSLREEQGILEIVIRDTGQGIPAAIRDRIFVQGFSTKGTQRGYGLALVRQAVLSCRGEIQVESIENQGTTFTVRLPVGTGGREP